jgi:nitrite reductase (NADH) small subunit
MDAALTDRHVVGRLDDFPPGSHRVVTLGRREIGVFNIRGELYALPNVCPHQTGPLCEGKRLVGALEAHPMESGGWLLESVGDGEVIQCPWHQLEFHVPTGRCLAFPRISVRTYEVAVVGDDVLIGF